MRGRPLALACLILIFFLYLGTRMIDQNTNPYKELEGTYKSFTGQVYQKEETIQAGGEKRILYLKTATGERIRCCLKSGETMPELGRRLSVTGKIKNFQKATNQGQFDAQSYYHILKVTVQLNQTEIQEQSTEYQKGKEALYQFRKRLSGILDQTLSEKDAGVMKAMLLGEKESVSGEIKELYQRNGIAHILAISGLHISLLGMGLYRVLRKLGLPKGLRTLLPVCLMLSYGMMTGFSVSALRAITMFALDMLAIFFGRTYDLITAVSLVAVLILVEQPLYLYSSSFQFSFGCIYGMAFLVPALTKRTLADQPALQRLHQWENAFLSGAALTCATLPIQMVTFFQVPFSSVFLNIGVIPLMSLLLPSGILLMCFYKVPILQALFRLFVSGILLLYQQLCLMAQKIPFAQIVTGKPFAFQFLLYLLILFLIVCFQKKLSLWKRWLLMGMGIAVLLFPFRALSDRGKLEICFLDVGQGDCIYLSTPEGNHYLVDGGSSTVNEVGEYRILQFLRAKGVKRLDAVINTHPDQDHCNGILELLDPKKNQEVQIGCLLLPDIMEKEEESYQRLCRAAEEAEIMVDYLHTGEQILEGAALDNLQITCVHPDKASRQLDANEYSLVLLLTFGEFSALLTGDVEGRGEEELYQELKSGYSHTLRNGLTVLKAAHHGSSGSSSEEILKLLSPQITVISCGEKNAYGHPHQETLERLSLVGSRVYQTQYGGAITIKTDGRQVEVDSFVKANRESK